jgi:hypothetical protein
MRINYIVLVHKNSKQLRRLVEKLSAPNAYFYIHVDQNTEIQPFKDALGDQPRIDFLKLREKGTWGDVGIVKASINALKEITKEDEKGYCVLLSGQDYPIKSNVQIDSFLQKNYGTNFIDVSTFDEVGWSGKWAGRNRIQYYKLNISEKRGHYVQLPSLLSKDFYKYWRQSIRSLILLARSKIVPLAITKRRNFPKFMTPYGGSQWWAIPVETTVKILKFLDQNKQFIEYNRYSLLPDEFFFHSIIKHLASTDKTIIIKLSITYVNWKRKGVPLPVTFTSEDIEELRSQPEGKLLARKFDMDVSDEIFDLL